VVEVVEVVGYSSYITILLLYYNIIENIIL